MWLFFVFYIRRNVSVNFQVKKKKCYLKEKKISDCWFCFPANGTKITHVGILQHPSPVWFPGWEIKSKASLISVSISESNSPLDRRTIFSRKVFCGATNPLLPPCIMEVSGQKLGAARWSCWYWLTLLRCLPGGSLVHRSQDRHDGALCIRTEASKIKASL